MTSLDEIAQVAETMRQAYHALDLEAIINDPTILTISPMPVDDTTATFGEGEAFLPGSIYKFFNESPALDQFFAAREGQAVTINVQNGCPFLFGAVGITETKRHELSWRMVGEACQEAADEHNCTLTFNVTEDGLALSALS